MHTILIQLIWMWGVCSLWLPGRYSKTEMINSDFCKKTVESKDYSIRKYVIGLWKVQRNLHSLVLELFFILSPTPSFDVVVTSWWYLVFNNELSTLPLLCYLPFYKNRSNYSQGYLSGIPCLIKMKLNRKPWPSYLQNVLVRWFWTWLWPYSNFVFVLFFLTDIQKS